MGSPGSRDHRALVDLLDFQAQQGFLGDVGPLDLRGMRDLEDPQECLAFEVTRGLMACLENRGSQEKGGSQGPMDPLDQLGPRVNQVLWAALGVLGWLEPWGRRASWGSLGSQASGAPQVSQDSRVQLAQLGHRAYLA